MPAKADPAWIHALDALSPTVGTNYRGFVNRSAIEVGVWRFVEGGEHGGAIQDGGSTSLPSFRSRDGGEILRAAIMHYMATSARLQWWGWLFRYAIGRMTLISLASRAAPRRAYKGAWRGLHVGTGVDTTWSPRLSPMRVRQGNPPWAVSGSAMGLSSVILHGPV
jgi:hypothetical protein